MKSKILLKISPQIPTTFRIKPKSQSSSIIVNGIKSSNLNFIIFLKLLMTILLIEEEQQVFCEISVSSVFEENYEIKELIGQVLKKTVLIKIQFILKK